MSQSQDICRANRIVTSGKGSSAAVGCDIDGSDLPPLVVRNAPMFVILQVIFNDYFRKPKICCTQTRTVIAPPRRSTTAAWGCSEPRTKMALPAENGWE